MASGDDSQAPKQADPKPADTPIVNASTSNGVALFSGSGIGLLVGILMGMSVSPTVGVVIGALASSLALILGLNDKHVSIAKSLRIGAFGFLCAAGALTGTYLRSHQVLAPGPEEAFARYSEMGFEKREVLDLIKLTRFGIQASSDASAPSKIEDAYKRYSELGLEKNEILELISRTSFDIPASSKAGKAPNNDDTASNAASLTQLVHTGVLYGAEIDAGTCTILAEKTESNIADYYYLVGGMWKNLAIATEQQFGVEKAPRVLLAMRDGICGGDSTAKQFENCKIVSAINEQTGSDQIRKLFTEAGPEWISLLDPIDTSVAVNDRQAAFLILQRSLCDDKK